MGDAFHLGADLLVQRILRIQRIQDLHRSLDRVDARIGNCCMRHLAVDCHFQLQATVVRGDDLVAEACGDHQIGVDDVVLEQPGRADLATELFVVGEQQLDAAFGGTGHGFECAQREGIGREVAFADR